MAYDSIPCIIIFFRLFIQSRTNVNNSAKRYFFYTFVQRQGKTSHKAQVKCQKTHKSLI